jgi:hypothetical protein
MDTDMRLHYRLLCAHPPNNQIFGYSGQPNIRLLLRVTQITEFGDSDEFG